VAEAIGLGVPFRPVWAAHMPGSPTSEYFGPFKISRFVYRTDLNISLRCLTNVHS